MTLTNAEFIVDCRRRTANCCWAADPQDIEEALSRLEAAEKRIVELEDMKPFAESVAAKTAIGLSKTIEQLRERIAELKRENAELRASHAEQEEMVAELRKLAQANRAKIVELEKERDAWKRVAFDADAIKMAAVRELDTEIEALNFRLTEQAHVLGGLREELAALHKNILDSSGTSDAVVFERIEDLADFLDKQFFGERVTVEEAMTMVKYWRKNREGEK